MFADWSRQLQEGLQENNGVKVRKVEKECRAFLKKDPKSFDAWYLLGFIASRKGQHAVAERFFQRARELRRGDASFWDSYGVVKAKTGDLTTAIASFRKACALHPQMLSSLDHLSYYLVEIEHFVQAEPLVENLVEINQKNSAFWYRLANVKLSLGKLTEAKEAFETVLQCTEDKKRIFLTLFGLARIESLRGNTLNRDQYVHEALRGHPDYEDLLNIGLLQASLGLRKEALISYRTALRQKPNALAALGRLILTFPQELNPEERGKVERALQNKKKSEYTAQLLFGKALQADREKKYGEAVTFAQKANCMMEEIVGDSALSTRKVNDSLVKQCKALYSSEYFEKVKIEGRDQGENFLFIVGMPRSGSTLLEQILSSHPEIIGAGENSYIGHSISLIARWKGRPTLPYTEALRCADSLSIAASAQYYQNCMRELAPKNTYVINKLLMNYLYLGWIATLFPKAKVIHCRRNLRDVTLSCWMTLMRKVHWSFSFEGILGEVCNYLTMMQHWKKVLPLPLLDVDYEDLVEDMQETVSRVLAFCGVQWDDRCLHFQENGREALTASASQVRQPLYKTSVGRWKHYEKDLQAIFEQIQDSQ